MDSDRPIDEGLKSRAVGALAAVALMPIYFAFSHFHQRDRGLLFVSITIVFFLVAYAKSKQIRRIGFLSILLLLYAIHVIAVFSVALPPRLSGAAALGLGFLDALLVMAAMTLIEKKQVGSKSQA